jgi:hypothetical protein
MTRFLAQSGEPLWKAKVSQSKLNVWRIQRLRTSWPRKFGADDNSQTILVGRLDSVTVAVVQNNPSGSRSLSAGYLPTTPKFQEVEN